jgi:hypothetical protein
MDSLALVALKFLLAFNMLFLILYSLKSLFVAHGVPTLDYALKYQFVFVLALAILLQIDQNQSAASGGIEGVVSGVVVLALLWSYAGAVPSGTSTFLLVGPPVAGAIVGSLTHEKE